MFGKREKKERKRITSTGGHSFWVDISDQALSRFGFKHNDRVQIKICSSFYHATIMGVAHEYEWQRKDKGREVMWFAYDGYDGRVTPGHDLVKGDNITLLR